MVKKNIEHPKASQYCLHKVLTGFMWFRSQAQDEQKTQHGEPGADETHSRQDECKNCSHVPLLSFLLCVNQSLCV